MVEKVEEYENLMNDKVNSVIEDHPMAVTGLLSVLGLGISVLAGVAVYRYAGKTAGKAAAKELIEAGIFTGYTHK